MFGSGGAILKEGRNCWRKESAGRLAFLVDVQDYFGLLLQALRAARRTVYIAGWDVDRRVSLIRRAGGPGGADAHTLDEVLDRIIAEAPELRAYVLVWDFAMIYALDRESSLLFGTRWSGRHPRLHFHLDDRHPVGASHHQKIVVVDDAVAFAGGVDITKSRWDTPEHLPRDPRRVDPSGAPYAPFHDVQVLVDGMAAKCLGDLFRERWRRATGSRLPAPGPAAADPWPAEARAALTDVEVAIARTEPGYEGRREVREVEACYLDMIAAARERIYIENQFFTSRVVQSALAARLASEEGPEIVLVLPRDYTGWLEQNVLGSLQARALAELRRADAHGRLRVYFPRSGDHDIFVHSKLMVVDEGLVRVGSSNLTNRSMGLDTECDLAVEADGEARVEGAIGSFRDRLLAEHLDVSSATLADALKAERGSMIRTVEGLRGRERTLEPLSVEEQPEWLASISPTIELLDPERPSELGQAVEEIAREDGAQPRRRGWVWLALVLVAASGLAALWQFGPVADAEGAVRMVSRFKESPLAPLYVTGAYVIGSLVLFPITLLIIGTAAVFEPAPACAYALAGSLAGALTGYSVGITAGRKLVKRLAGKRVSGLRRRIAERGLTAVAVSHLVPVAPFTIVNLLAGASRIRMRDFLLGTLLGMVPGIVYLTFFTGWVIGFADEPSFTRFLPVAAAGLLLLGGLYLWRRLSGRRTTRAPASAALKQPEPAESNP
ncbi:MAG: VTT domain-containing protein [bacterium]